MRSLPACTAAFGLLFCWSISIAAEPGAVAEALDVSVTPNTPRLMPYQVFELTFRHDGNYDQPTWDILVDVAFQSPSGRESRVGGFFYGSSQSQDPVIREWTDARGQKHTSATWPCDPADLWKARFAPSETGRWQYRYEFRNPRGQAATGSGQFEVVPARVPVKGWLRVNPDNPFRLVFEDGTPFYPVGFQDGVFDGNNNGSAMDAKSMEGPFRPDPEGRRPQPPPGALFARGPSMNPVNGDVYFGRHARAGFNLWRFSPHNFSLDVFPGSLDDVDWKQAAMVDEMLQLLHKYDIRIFYGIFGFARVFNDEPQNAEGMAKVKRMIKYSVDRWGAYTDFWELLNEQHASDAWYAETTAYLRSIDPYDKLIATSWQRPELDGIDINAPHWYGNEDELMSDRVTAGHIADQKRFRKPVIWGEQGNSRGREDRTADGIGGVWDPGSSRRMRVRLWTAMFQEAALVFWETSYAKDGHHMNIWLGPEERQYVHALQDFAGHLDADVRITPVELAGHAAESVRAYGLRSGRIAAVYLHHTSCRQCADARRQGTASPHRWDHDRGPVADLSVTIEVPRKSHAYWYDPRDASFRRAGEVPAGRRTLKPPEFSIDLALLLTSDGPPDIDRDGLANDEDPDDDNDGFDDTEDAFPLEREEWADVDQDRIGDNQDADLDGDGQADDRNNNGVPDNEEPDADGDGYPRAGAIPWDAFPLDPNEWQDTDGDGIGDNADTDDDGDGCSDEEEEQAGTDPKSAIDFPDSQASEGERRA